RRAVMDGNPRLMRCSSADHWEQGPTDVGSYTYTQVARARPKGDGTNEWPKTGGFSCQGVPRSRARRRWRVEKLCEDGGSIEVAIFSRETSGYAPCGTLLSNMVNSTRSNSNRIDVGMWGRRVQH